MKKWTHEEIDNLDRDEARAALKRCMKEAAEEEDDDDDDDEKDRKNKDDDDDDDDKDDSAKAAAGMRLIGKLLGRGAARGLWLSDCTAVEGEQLIRDFRRLRVPFLAAYWGGQARFLSLGKNSTAGTRVPAATVTAEWFASAMLSGDGLDQVLVSGLGTKDTDLKGAALNAMAGAMRAAARA